MSSVNFKTRIQLKNNSTAYWNELTDFVPLQGEMIIYNDNPPRMKIGDGITKLQDLVFASALVDNTLSSTSENAIANKAVYTALNAKSGVSAGNYGPSANASPGSSGTFSVPYFTVNAQGKVTAAATRTITMPAATSVSLNGADTTAASFYAPADAGTKGYVLISNGSGAPTWKAASTLATGQASSVAWTNITSKPSYYDAKAITSISRSGTTFTATYLDGSTTTFSQQDNNTTYTASTGVTMSGTDIRLATSGVTAGSYGPTANVNGSNGATISVPQITVDAYGRVTSVTNRTYTSVDTDTNTTYSLSGLGGVGTVTASGTAPLTLSASKSGTTVTITGSIAGASSTSSGLVTTGAQSFAGNKTFTGSVTAASVHGAVWNDYAEYRAAEVDVVPGSVVYCDDDGCVKPTTERLQKFEGIVSDTFGFSIGKTDEAKTPLAVSGRVLAYTYEDRSNFHSGDAVCAAPDGKISLMTREEIVQYPDRIIGIVSEIPKYEIWGEGKVQVNNRIWIRIK